MDRKFSEEGWKRLEYINMSHEDSRYGISVMYIVWNMNG